MIKACSADLRSRLCEAYTSRHADRGEDKAPALVYRRDIRPLLPSTVGPIADIGSGRGELVQLLQAEGSHLEGIDISPEQATLTYTAGVGRVPQGEFRDVLAASGVRVSPNDCRAHRDPENPA